LPQLKDCKNLAFLHLQGGKQITDAGLADLAGLNKLTYLNLADTQVTAKGVAGLAKALPKCKIEWDGGVIEPTASVEPDRRAAEYVLSIGGTVFVDVDDREIKIGAKGDLPAGMFRLTYVDLMQNKQVTDGGLAAFQGCKNLKSLDLRFTQVGDDGLVHLKDCKALRSLDLNTTKVTDTGLAHFRDCTGLKELGLAYTAVTDAGLSRFQDCKDLGLLDLHGCAKITDAGLADLKDWKNLWLLNLDHTKVTDATLARCKDCKNLYCLGLRATQVTDEGLACLTDRKELNVLSLAETKVTDAGLAHLKDCKHLLELYLDGTKAGDTGLANFKGIDLTLLSIQNTGITDLTPLQGMRLGTIYLTPKNITKGLDILRDMKSVNIGINSDQTWPAAEFWERYDKGEFK
jgi:Leucine-rich repeat (LRR) protein